jgi:hypothetical protein
MTLDGWFTVGGILGAILRRWRATDEGNAWRLYVLDAAVAALGGPLLAAFGTSTGLIPEDAWRALTSTPLRAIALGAIPAYMGLDLLTLTSARWRGQGNGR